MSDMKWIAYRKQGLLPPERRNVLLAIREAETVFLPNGNVDRHSHAAIVAVGYLRIHSAGPFWVVPGVPHQDEEITHWCDFLGDDFGAPVWKSKQVAGPAKRRWHHPPGYGLIYWPGDAP
jgi:hypothetical protein